MLLASTAQVLYQLQKGPMLGTVMGHADEKALLHSILLGAPMDLSQALLLPVLHIHNRDTGHFDATPAANLALYPGEYTYPCYLWLQDPQ